MEPIYSYKSFDLTLKDVDTKGNTVTGYFASFDTIDSYGEMFVKGAFANTIKQNFNRIKHLLDHDTTKAVGKIQILTEENTGLYYESKIGSHYAGRDFLKMAESGLITEHSVGFQYVKGKTEVKDEICYLKEVKLMEGSSLQAWGANQHTPFTGIKGMADVDRVTKRMKALETFVKNTDATDETIELLMLEIKQLNQLIIDLQKPIEPDVKSIQPGRIDMKAAAIALAI